MEVILWLCGPSIDDPSLGQIPIATSLGDTVDVLLRRPLLDKIIKNGNALLFLSLDEFEERLIPDALLHITLKQCVNALELGTMNYHNSKKVKNDKIYFIESKFSSMEIVYTNHMETTGVIVLRIDWNNLRHWHCKPHLLSMDQSENEKEYLDTWKLRNVHIKAIILILKHMAQDALDLLYYDQKDIVITTLFASYLGIK
jgi:hypothetical protein